MEEHYDINDENRQKAEFIIAFYRYAFVGIMMDVMTKDPEDTPSEYNENPEYYVDLILDTIEHDITDNILMNVAKPLKDA